MSNKLRHSVRRNISTKSRQQSEEGFTLTEILVTVVVIGILATTLINASLRELRRYRVDSAAALYASWLDTVSRSALKGQGCLAILTVGTSIEANASAASAGADTQTTPSTPINNPCSTIEELKLSRDSSNHSFIVSITPSGTNSIVFTPRGTIYNPNSDTGTFASDLSIKLQGYANGSAMEPAKCITIQPPTGQIRSSNCS